LRLPFALMLALAACAHRDVKPDNVTVKEKKHPFNTACVSQCMRFTLAGQPQAHIDCISLCLLDITGEWVHSPVEECSSSCQDWACQRACCEPAGLDPFCCAEDVSCTDTPGPFVKFEGVKP